MSRKFSLLREDFDARICRFTTPDAIPLSYRIGETVYSGIPAEFAPEIRSEKNEKSDKISRTVITGTSPEGLTVRVEYEEYEDYPVTEWLAFFTNNGKEDTPPLSDLKFVFSALNMPDGAGKPSLVHGIGEENRDGYVQYTSLINHEIGGASRGRPCTNGVFPYMRLICGGETGNPTAEPLCVNIAIGWPASWYYKFIPCPGGIEASFGFPFLHASLHPGETIRSPHMTYMTTLGGETRSRNAWRRWYFEYILPKDNGERLKPMLVLHHANMHDGFTEFEGADEESQITGYTDYLKNGLKPDIWWIDAGWYKGHKWRNVGSWEVDREHFPNTIAPVGELCEKNGTKLLLWFEPERVYEGSDLDVNMPWRVTKWFNPEEGKETAYRFYYLGDPDNWSWMTERLDFLIKQNKVKIYRQDMNIWPSHYYEVLENGDENRVGVPENLHTQGYLAMWDELLRRNPGMLIDSCASGGCRNDLETMRRSFPLHYTDQGYGEHPLKQRQYRTHFSWIPYFRSHTTSWDDENGNYPPSRKVAVPHPFVDRFSYHNTMTPSVTCTVQHDAPEEEFALAREMLPIWRKAAELMLSGDYYPLTECQSDSTLWYATEFYDDKRGEGFIQFIRNVKCENDTFTAYPFAEDGAVYTLTDPETGRSFRKTAEELESGLTVTLPPRSGILFFMKKD